MSDTVYVINGSNLNLLGTREPEKYGRATLADVESLCRETARKHGFAVEFRQSNSEGEIIDFIHEAGKTKAAGIIINPAAYTAARSWRRAALGRRIPRCSRPEFCR